MLLSVTNVCTRLGTVWQIGVHWGVEMRQVSEAGQTVKDFFTGCRLDSRSIQVWRQVMR